MRGGVEVEQFGQAGTDLDLELPVWDPAKKRLQPDLSFTHRVDFANLSLGLFFTSPQTVLNRKLDLKISLKLRRYLSRGTRPLKNIPFQEKYSDDVPGDFYESYKKPLSRLILTNSRVE